MAAPSGAAHAQHGTDKFSNSEQPANSAPYAVETGDDAEQSNQDAAPETSIAPANPYNDPKDPPVHGNGIGPDPDGDSNPATVTRPLAKIGDAAEASFDPPY
ncbi:MAG: hypothetical protein AAGJ87_17510, partial [Pseudomonadota bacterium]